MADTAEKPVKSLAERQRDAMIGTEETIQRFKELGVGVLKAVTTDLPGFLMDVADKLAGDTATLGEKDRSAQMFKSITGIESKGTNAELLGSMLGPESAVKAMVVGAARAVRAGSRVVTDLPLANELMSEGLKNSDVFMNTGVYKDIDFERKAIISDAGARASVMLTTPGQVTDLQNLISHPELFKIYPELKEMTVTTRSGKGGTYFPNTKEIVVGTDYTPAEARGVLLHEIQHAIQNIEGFGRGGSVKGFLNYPADKVYETMTKLPPTESPSVAGFREKVKAKAKVDYLDAYDKYYKLPGEQEARFTQGAQFLSEPDLNAEVQRMLSRGATPSNQFKK